MKRTPLTQPKDTGDEATAEDGEFGIGHNTGLAAHRNSGAMTTTNRVPGIRFSQLSDSAEHRRIHRQTQRIEQETFRDRSHRYWQIHSRRFSNYQLWPTPSPQQPAVQPSRYHFPFTQQPTNAPQQTQGLNFVLSLRLTRALSARSPLASERYGATRKWPGDLAHGFETLSWSHTMLQEFAILIAGIFLRYPA
ncbi:hypothetical protein FDECE_13962 [Fusarium decemcellulare]|nr:hypothetical protein FDECE_13962 [Fusarium decemcellulare]